MRRIISVCIVFIPILLSGTLPASALIADEWNEPGRNVEDRIDGLISAMTVEEKVSLCSGGFSCFKGIPRLDIPDVGWCDGPRGPNGQPGVTAFPSGILFGATWNPEIVAQAGAVMGEETRAMKRGILLGPACNILRDPLCGRFFEYYTEDPYLNSVITVAHVKGIQSQGVAACLKHYACNSRENNRNFYMSVVDDRTMHEIYLPAFKAAVEDADLQTVMTSANGMNYEFVSDSRKMLTDILKDRWGFRGFVMTDWLQTRSTEKAAFAGLDVSMPGGDGCGFGTALLDAVKAGRVPVSVIDEKVRRILRVYDFIGILDREDRSAGAEIASPEHAKVALDIAEQGIVLLKNENGALPLDERKVKSVLVLGPDADKRFCLAGMGGSSCVESPYEVTVLQGIRNILGDRKVIYLSFDDLGGFRPMSSEVSPEDEGFTAEYFVHGSGVPALVRKEKKMDFMWEMKSPDPSIKADDFREAHFELKFIPPVDGKYTFRFTAGGGDMFVFNNEWAGAPVAIADPSKGVGRVSASLDLRKNEMLRLCIVYHKHVGDAAVRVEWQSPQTELADMQWRNIERAARKADAVVFVGGIDHSIDTEGRDRLTMNFPQLQEMLIKNLVKWNRQTHVVLVNGSPMEIGGWLPDVASLVEAWYPGMEGGNAVANVLFGRINPSGRMPFTWPGKLEDDPSHRFGWQDDVNVLYTDGLKVGYRYFDTAETEPEFAFGYGLSYTSFDYRDMKLRKTGPAGVAGSVEVHNTGDRDGYEVVQVYVRPLAPSVERPGHELKWFRKVFVPAGESVRVDFELGKDAFSYYDVHRADWTVDPGEYEIEVCRDSRNTVSALSCTIE